MILRQTLDVFSIQSNKSPKFAEKISKAFWRGRDSNRARLDLVLISKRNPDLVDAALTNVFFFDKREKMEKYLPIVNHTNFYDFFQVIYDMIL